MWDYDEFVGKAQVYFERAREHPKAENEVIAIWLLLGLEFLLRAPLAKIHPALLAEPDAVMHAAGYPGSEGAEPKSIQTKTVVSRLTRIVSTFTPEREKDVAILTNLRNKELHSSSVAVGVDLSFWLPRFMQVVDSLCTHLGIKPEDLLGRDLVAHGRALVNAENQKVKAEVKRRMDACENLYGQLRPEEIKARRRNIPDPSGMLTPLFDLGDHPTHEAGLAWHKIREESGTEPEIDICPACGEKVAIRLTLVRTTSERIEEESIFRDVVYVASEMSCAVCGLRLNNTAEISAAGLPQQYTRAEEETLEDRYAGMYDGPDYGND
ncbi:DUF3811 domain-containing protein [Catellatospora sichuanensis]|uniref:DUF3811 domain-containing protein n=1 Tax=Catellatospora sichuanensis TaxID=1969805 RepID=UPI0011830EB1|nr:DUF3811 domain-containing protein [Catellatospora sichuanensis]